jgi:predicted transcriptional regulator YdeE
MTTQDLKDNRDRIIKSIKFQQITEISKVMSRMIEMLNWSRFNDAKATMKNIDQLTKEAISAYFKNDYNESMTANEFEEYRREQTRKNLPSSMR